MDESAAHRNDADARETRLVSGSAREIPASAASGSSFERAPGTLIGGRYRLERQLNAGGMGTVHLAQPLGGNQKVVVKFPHAHLLSSPGFPARFAHEIQALQKLTHPHVVEIYDAGTDRVREAGVERELPYLVVRYMGGGSLKDRIVQAGGRLPPAQLAWLRPIADALDFIHSQNVLHLDVKPENLLFDVHGTVYLTDFGIAKLTGADLERDFTGILGSPSYMAPEYTDRARASPSEQYKLDQYSLAVVVYEALCGALPHGAQSVPELLASKLEDPPESLAERCPELPKALTRAVMRGLALDPGERFDSCGDFADAVLASVRPARRRTRWPLALLGAALLASGGVYAYLRLVPPSLDAQITSVNERLAEVDAHESGARDKLLMLRAQTDAVVKYAADLQVRAGPRRRPYGGANGAASLGLREVERALAEIEILRSHAETEQRELAALRDRVSAVQTRATLLQHRAEAQRSDVRAQADQVFDVHMRLARLQDQTSRLRRPDRRIAALARSVAELEGSGSADASILASIEAQLDATLLRATALFAGIGSDERSLDDESQKLTRSETALRARRAALLR